MNTGTHMAIGIILLLSAVIAAGFLMVMTSTAHFVESKPTLSSGYAITGRAYENPAEQAIISLAMTISTVLIILSFKTWRQFKKEGIFGY